MSNVETRQVNRDSLFLLAQVRVDGQEEISRVKVRNLSAGGMMAEGEAKVVPAVRWSRFELRKSAGSKARSRGAGQTVSASPSSTRSTRRWFRGPGGPARARPNSRSPRYNKNHQASAASQQDPGPAAQDLIRRASRAGSRRPRGSAPAPTMI
jgi:hypothetical protein